MKLAIILLFLAMATFLVNGIIISIDILWRYPFACQGSVFAVDARKLGSEAPSGPSGKPKKGIGK